MVASFNDGMIENDMNENSNMHLTVPIFLLFSEATKDGSSWPAVSLLLQNVFIFLASLTYKFGRSEESWN